EVTVDRQREHVQGVVDSAVDQGLVPSGRPAKHPGSHQVLVPRVADADPQAVEASMPKQAHGVPQAVLTAVAAVELQPCRAGRQVELVMCEQHLRRLDLPVTQGRGYRLAGQVHESGRLEQPEGGAADTGLRRLAEQPGIHLEAHPERVRQGVDKPEPGIVPGPVVLGAGVAQPHYQAQTVVAGHSPLDSSPSAASPSPSSSAPPVRPFRATTTAMSWSGPSARLGISTPSGSCTWDRWMVSPRSRLARSTTMFSGRSFGRQLTSTWFSSFITITSAFLPAGEISSLMKCSGTEARRTCFWSMRWKSRCMITCLYGWRWMSRRITLSTLPSTSRLRIDE